MEPLLAVTPAGSHTCASKLMSMLKLQPHADSQVSSYISFTKEDSDESKKAELEGVVNVGDVVHVKVGGSMFSINHMKSDDSSDKPFYVSSFAP